MNKKSLYVLGFAAVFSSGVAFAYSAPDKALTKDEVLAAQKAWGAALIQISQDYAEGGLEKATATASAVLDQAYGYNLGPVLFKPTLTSGDTTFRTTQEGALAYFVGGNPDFPDSGFALKGWQEFAFENAAVLINDNMALTMGNVMLTNADGDVTTVDKTWGFLRDDAGDLRIVLHHSSLPFNPE
ncbi:MAG: phosphoribosyl-AMP cyclohydrolase [Nitrincola sp.]|nr:phosphoribosyl-AMP cyclohydrolase [Nitrincola sp.]